MIPPLCHYAWGWKTRPLQHSGETWHVKWRSGRLRRWTLVNMEMMLELWKAYIDLLIKGMLIKKMCAYIWYVVLCANSTVVDPEVVRSLTPEKAFPMYSNQRETWQNHDFLKGKTMPPSFHVHNSKCDNPTLAQHQRGGLSFHAFWASRVSPAFSLMREIWWNAPTINHSNQRNQELIERKDQPQNQNQKSQPPNHPNAQTLPCPSQCYQWQSQCKVLTWSRWKRAVAPVVARKNAPIKETLKRGGFLWCSSTIQNKKPSLKPACSGALMAGCTWGDGEGSAAPARNFQESQRRSPWREKLKSSGHQSCLEVGWRKTYPKIGWVGWGCPWGWLRLVALRLVAARFWTKKNLRVLTERKFNQLTMAYDWLNSHWQKWSSAVWEPGLNPSLVGRFPLLTTCHLPFAVSFLKLTSQKWSDRNLKGNYIVLEDVTFHFYDESW